MSDKLAKNRAESLAKYSDIMQLPHHVSTKHPQMSNMDRAAQFSPFAALVGFEDSIAETGRLTDSFIDMDEGVKEQLDRMLADLQRPESAGRTVRVTFFVPDERKEGGVYSIAEKIFKKIEYAGRQLVFGDGSSIAVEDIFAIEFADKSDEL